jgi:uncharacterized membrane protein
MFGNMQKNFFLYKKINFLYVLNRFNMLILKITFKKYKKYHFNIFQHKKYFKKQPKTHSKQ